MKNRQNASILRGLVENLPDDTLGLKGSWSWKPVVNLGDVTMSLLLASPTTEYSSNESNE